MQDYSTDALLELIEQLGAIPADQNTYTEEQIIQLADTQLRLRVVPLLSAAKADFFIGSQDVTTTTATSYDIPADAMNGSLHSVFFVDDNDEETELTYVNFNQEAFRPLNHPNGACFTRGDSLVIWPSVSAGRTLRMYYQRRPNRLVVTSLAARVLSVDTETGVVTCESVPSDWAAGDSVCCVKGTPGFKLRFRAAELVDSSSPTITLDPADAADIVEGDWISTEGESPIAQIPAEAHPLLAQATIVKVLEGLEDPGLNNAKLDLRDITQLYTGITGPRIEQGPPRIFNNKKLSNYIF